MLTLTSLNSKSQVLKEKTTDSTLIAFTADTQAPMWVETIWLKAHKNKTATQKIFDDILQQRPSSLFILGDVVNLGYSNKQWRPMDNYLRDFRSNNIHVNAILGNHEVMGRAKKGQQKFQSRFPNHSRTGYVQIIDSVAIILLNSNFKTLSKTENAQQISWYKSTLRKLDADSSVEFIITTCHHSPYTNSKVVKPCVAVQQKFVPPFLNSKKTRLFLSGHCHGFEHYQVEGKDFLVIGGGGGLQQPLNHGNGMLPDLALDYKPSFHYITIRRKRDDLELTSLHLKNDFSGFEEGMKLTFKNNNESSFNVSR